jgi:hypothetical protein
MICYIPQGTVLSLGWTTFNIYNSCLGSGTSGCALVYASFTDADTPLMCQVANLAKDNSFSVANQLQVKVFANNAGGAYTTQGPITLYVELRY